MQDRQTAFVRRRYERHARYYDRNERMIKVEWRRQVIDRARGRVLEIGLGTGQNLGLYDPDKVTEVVGIDLSPAMLEWARQKPSRVPVTLLEMDAQRLAFADAEFDTVLATCVFCAVPDPVAGLQEAARVCKPDGQILLLEHVRLDKPVVGTLMDLVNPLFRWVAGCNLNRQTVATVAAAGLVIEDVKNVWGELGKVIIARPPAAG